MARSSSGLFDEAVFECDDSGSKLIAARHIEGGDDWSVQRPAKGANSRLVRDLRVGIYGFWCSYPRHCTGI